MELNQQFAKALARNKGFSKWWSCLEKFTPTAVTISLYKTTEKQVINGGNKWGNKMTPLDNQVTIGNTIECLQASKQRNHYEA